MLHREVGYVVFFSLPTVYCFISCTIAVDNCGSSVCSLISSGVPAWHHHYQIQISPNLYDYKYVYMHESHAGA